MVASLNHFCSPARRHGIWLFRPITRFRVMATIAFMDRHLQGATGWLDGDWRFDSRVRIVTNKLDIFVAKILQPIWDAAKKQYRQRPWGAGQLLVNLFEVVPVNMDVSEGVNKLSRRQPAHRRDHFGQQ